YPRGSRCQMTRQPFSPMCCPAVRRSSSRVRGRLHLKNQEFGRSLSLRSGEPRLLVDGARAARYLRSGHLIYAVKGALVVAPLDPESLTVTAPFVKVVNDERIDVSDPRTV